MAKEIKIESVSNPEFIDIRIKRNGSLYTLKALNADGLVVKKQFESVEELAIEVLEHFKIYGNNN